MGAISGVARFPLMSRSVASWVMVIPGDTYPCNGHNRLQCPPRILENSLPRAKINDVIPHLLVYPCKNLLRCPRNSRRSKRHDVVLVAGSDIWVSFVEEFEKQVSRGF